MAQLMSGVVLGGVAEVVGSNLARGKILQNLSAQLIHYILLYIYCNQMRLHVNVFLLGDILV